MLKKNEDINILIVEDEIILALSLELSLQEMQYKVSGIESTANQAIIHAQNHFPDIVLMDINLNDSKTGIDAANTIWKRFNIPIVFLTSYSNDKTLQAAMESEPYGYLIKPCKDKEIKACINMAIHKHSFFFKNKEKARTNNSSYIQISEDIRYDKNNSNLYKNEKIIKLTKNEKKLFEIITQYSGEVVPFNRISTYIWREEVYDMGKIRTLIYRLKIKIGTNPFENFYEEGYKIKKYIPHA